MSERIEHRQYARAPIFLDVQVRLGAGVLVEGHARDISLNGLFLQTERSLPLGTRVKIKMTVGTSAEKTVINCGGSVSRVDAQGVAIKVGQIDDESMAQLCGIIRDAALNTVRMEDAREKQLVPTPVLRSGLLRGISQR